MHLGAKPDAGNAYSQNREQELWDSFRDIITICNRKKTDLLLIAGDLFHRQPLLRELKEMNSILEMLEQTEVVMIAGNHDQEKLLLPNIYLGTACAHDLLAGNELCGT